MKLIMEKPLNCPSFKTLEDCVKNDICSWGSKTNKCAKKRISKKQPKVSQKPNPQPNEIEPIMEKPVQCISFKTSEDCGKNEICSWSSKSNKCNKKTRFAIDLIKT